MLSSLGDSTLFLSGTIPKIPLLLAAKRSLVPALDCEVQQEYVR